ncbi:MAG: sugar transferase [Pseudomonadota bacterium]|nr:sugar transferase [Pseudomonadota bacterium]MEE3098131.1 sugar transferase [Pseudomonadota bacterium]
MKHLQPDGQFYAADAITPASGPSFARVVYETGGKRALDLVLAIALVPVLAPVILGLAALVWAKDGGAPFFGHTRIGRGGRKFRCWKIRSMVLDSQARLEKHLAENPAAAMEWRATRKLNNDPRITRVGAFIRKTSLDELPQLWNVLRGEMSFVGPRPVPEDELNECYGSARSVYCSLRPGITGLWQVSGRNDVSYAHRVSMDVEYLRRMAVGLDLWIMLRTALVVVQPTGK